MQKLFGFDTISVAIFQEKNRDSMHIYLKNCLCCRMHTGRIIIYIILVSAVALLGYFGARMGVRMLVWLSMTGIIFLVYNFFKHAEK
jgi:hypothetical protein